MWEHVRNSGSPRISLNQNLAGEAQNLGFRRLFRWFWCLPTFENLQRTSLSRSCWPPSSESPGFTARRFSGPSLSSHPLRCSEGKGSILHFSQAFPGEANACYIKSCLQGLTPARPLKMFQCPNTEAVWVISMPQAISTWLITCVEAVTWLIQVDTILEVP